jgi:DNA-binding SARP family transcriptional activator
LPRCGLEARVDADLHLGRHADVIVELKQLAAAEPLRERLHALLMLALCRAGQQAALAAYRALAAPQPQAGRRRVVGEHLADLGQERTVRGSRHMKRVSMPMMSCRAITVKPNFW